MKPHIRTYELFNIVAIVVIAFVVFIAAIFAYIEFSPIDVIRNDTWILCTSPIKDDNGKKKCQTGIPTFRVGDTITIYINSDKVKGAGSLFTTNAECKNKTGSFVSYYLSSAATNRAPGHVETSIDTKIPNTVPNLPTICRIAYVLEYQIYTFRSFSEYNFSNEFRLIPPATRAPVDKPANGPSSTSPSPSASNIASTPPATPISPSLPTNAPAPSTVSPQTPTTDSEEQKPGLINQAINSIVSLVKGIL